MFGCNKSIILLLRPKKKTEHDFFNNKKTSLKYHFFAEGPAVSNEIGPVTLRQTIFKQI